MTFELLLLQDLLMSVLLLEVMEVSKGASQPQVEDVHLQVAAGQSREKAGHPPVVEDHRQVGGEQPLVGDGQLPVGEGQLPVGADQPLVAVDHLPVVMASLLKVEIR